MKTTPHTAKHTHAMNLSIQLVHAACQLLMRNKYLSAHSKILPASINFSTAIAAIPTEEISTVISHVSESLRRYYEEGFSDADYPHLEKILDSMILIKGRDNFK